MITFKPEEVETSTETSLGVVLSMITFKLVDINKN